MPQRALVLFFFFLSGATSLTYEILWTRFLGGTIGNTHFSITVVVSVFMGGLAIGSAIGGRWADRGTNLLRLYALLTIATAIVCLAIPFAVDLGKPLFEALYRTRDGVPEAPLLLVVRIVFCVLLLLVPTTFMGATLPVLARHFTRDLSRVGSTVGGLYAVNTLGAVAGATWTGFAGIPALGLWGCNLLAAGIDIVCGVAILAIAARLPAPPAPARTVDATAEQPRSRPLPAIVRLAVAAFAIAGFANMLLQIAWTKALVLTIGNSTYAFSLIVTLFILGIAFGGGGVTLFVDRLRNLPLALGVCVFLTGTAIAASIPLLGYLPILGARLFDQVEEPSYGRFLWIQIVLISATILPSTFLMGTAFPIVGRIRTRVVEEVGSAIGSAYFWNTLGSILGTLAAGFILIPILGRIYSTLYLGAALSLVMGIILIFSGLDRAAIVRVATVALAAAAVLVPSYIARPHGVLGQQSFLWNPSILSQGAYVSNTFRHAYTDADGKIVPVSEYARHAIELNEILSYEEGIHAPVAVVRSPAGAVAMRISGKVEASLAPDGGYNNDLPHQIMAGHLPMVLHAAPRDVLTLGLGGGVTLGTLTLYPAETIDSLEISPEVIAAARDYFGAANRDALVNERVRNIVGDGRNHIEYTTQRYDVITSVPSNPWIAGIGNLFTVEFFQICKDRLKEGGIVCNWIHKINMREEDFRVVVRTFIEVFDTHAQIWDLGYDALLLGSTQPLRFDGERLGRLLEDERIAADLSGLGIHDAATFLRHYKGDLALMREFASGKGTSRSHVLNTDTFPVLEFSCPFGLYGHQLDAYRSLVSVSYTRDLADWVSGLESNDVERSRQLREAFHRYLLAFIRVVEIEKRVATARATGQRQPPEDLLERALTILSDLGDVARALKASGGDAWLTARANDLAHRALAVDPRPTLGATLSSWYVLAAKSQADRENALPFFDKALPFAGEDVETALEFAELSVQLGRAPAAVEVVGKALAGAPADARLWLASGVLARTTGRPDDALAAFEKGLALASPPRVQSMLCLELGFTLQNARRFEEALRFYEEAARIDPESELAQKHLASLRRHMSGS